ncbi:glycosyl transferase family 1 [Cellvibrio zantedeschiae]|uniref:Glycosyl transferase family 1 n=1 Tax=Cellvibrio zantedeschiae TaxID=1237077 RepID=A0ABQ3BBP7_9GAMM|nr:glycosyltransferase family 4 protein [Cellvibrio zantedeschiae]GGY82947.1 glycosyl transferase family 1 [Cellvibrio zantedeschiae]
MSYFPVASPKTITPVQPVNPSVSRSGLRIALLGYRSHPHVGGQGIYLHYLSKALVDLGHSVDVISGPPYPELDARVNLIQLPSLDLYAVENPTRALRVKHLFCFADFYEWWSKLSGGFGEPYCFGRRLVSYFKKHKPHYDIIHDNQSLCYGLLQLQNNGEHIIATVHHPITRDREIALESATTKGQRWLINRWYGFLHMQEKVAQQLNHIITVSKTSQQDIAKAFALPAKKITVIANGIDTEIFRPLPHIKRNPWQIITTASSDQPLKGLSVLLNALAQLRLEFPLLRLLVIGKLKADGITEKELHNLQLANCVEFKTGISTEQLVSCYAESKMAIVPSLYEGFGLPACEALACGIPLICSDGGALPEVVGDAALLVKAGDASALAHAIRTLLSSESTCEALSLAGRLHSLQHLSWQVVGEHLSDYYRHVLSVRENT